MENLHTFDIQQTKNLSVICESAERMKTYLQEIEMMFQKGSITVDTYFDYLSVPYPEGFISPEYTYVFNHSDIEEVVFLGFDNEEEQEFQAILRQA